MPIVQSHGQAEIEQTELPRTSLDAAAKLAELARNGIALEADALQPPVQLDAANLRVGGWFLGFIDAPEVNGWGQYARLLPSQSFFTLFTVLQAVGRYLLDVHLYQDQTNPQPISVTCQPAFENPEGPQGAQTVEVALQPVDQQHALFVLQLGNPGWHTLFFTADKEYTLVGLELTQIA